MEQELLLDAPDQIEAALSRLGELLEYRRLHFEMVIIGRELLEAARWARTHDPSPPFAEELRRALAHFGVTADDVDA